MPAEPPILDPHVHLWDHCRFTLPWVRGPLVQSYLIEDYLREGQGLGIVKSVYMEVAVTPSQRWQEVEWVLDLCRKEGPIAGAVIAGELQSPEFRQRLAKQANWAIKGVRQPLRGTPDALDVEFVRGVRWLGEVGMSFDLVGPLGVAMRLVDSCPKTQFILDHCGGVRLEQPDPSRVGARPGRHRGEAERRLQDLRASSDLEGWPMDDRSGPPDHPARRA